MKDDQATHWFAPLVADAERRFGGPLHAFEIMKNMIDAGPPGCTSRTSSRPVKKCGHLGGKVLVPDERVHHQAGGGAPGDGRVRRGHDPDRAHRRQQRHAAHERLRRGTTSAS